MHLLVFELYRYLNVLYNDKETTLWLDVIIKKCGKPPTYFGLFRPSSGRHSTKKYLFLVSYKTDVQ